jgi:glutamine synthetase
MRPIRNLLVAAGVPVENSKGEAETGQEELNIRYADALLCADHHTIAKQAVKEIADSTGHAATFMPKWHPTRWAVRRISTSRWEGGKPTPSTTPAPS